MTNSLALLSPVEKKSLTLISFLLAESLLSITYHNLCDCTETYRFDELLHNLA